MEQRRFTELVRAFGGVRAAVVGDIFLDRIFYINRDWDEPSVETGLPAYQVARRKCVPGAAGVVTNNLGALGVKKAFAVAVAGNDGEGFDLKKGLRETGIDTTYMVQTEDMFTPTYTKTFFEYPDRMEETHRIDIRNRRPAGAAVRRALTDNLLELEEQVDAFICLEQIPDAACGVFTPEVIETLSGIGRRKKARVFVDSRYHVADFKDVIVKCNDIEALRSAGMEEGAPKEREQRVELAMRKLAEQSSQPMFVSCGDRGMKVLENGAIRTVPAFRVEGPVDICGAGDSALAGIACAMCAGASPSEAALLGNLVASIIIQQIGVTGTATRRQLIERFQEYQERR